MKMLRYAYINRKWKIPAWIRNVCRSIAPQPMLMMMCVNKAMQLCWKCFDHKETRQACLDVCRSELEKWINELIQNGLSF